MDSYSLKSVLDLPEQFRSVFQFRYFNSLQSECFPICFHSDTNMVISAPTGSGKTALFELCILRLLSKFVSQEGKFVHINGTLKTVYIAPSKALVQEKLREWNQKFGSWGIVCLELTGDNEFYSTRNIQEADIILTTPEKFDAVTRHRIKDGGLSFFGDIALLLIDEVHLLNDPRGAALEAIVSRIKMISQRAEMKLSPLASVRYLAVSATIPNIDDLAEWLRVPPNGVKRFGEEMRPVKLTKRVFGYAPAKNDFLFEKCLQNYIFDLLMQFSRGKSTLVFCSTRKGAQEAAQKLSQIAMTFGYSNPFIRNQEQQERLREASLSCSDKQMQSYILYGVGYHNGGLSSKDRSLVECLFLKGDIQVLCTTNTLAHGINLPAHTVIIKSTQHFNKEKGRYTEYDRSTILQMCGRAGRPPFEDTGMVVIMTRRDTVHLYENLLNGCEVVESQLLSCVTEHLTAEIAQLTVSDITRAIEWMKNSYLYVRMKKNPEKYAVRKCISKDHIEKHIQDICVKKVNELSNHQLVWTDEDGFLLKPLEPGKLMTKYYLKFNTMKHIMQTTTSCSLEDLLHIVCHAEEISWIQLRRNEKKLLNDLNADKENRLRFHINDCKGKRKKRIQSREEKVFILANDCLTGDPSAHDISMTQDIGSICSNGCRIAKCMKEYFIYKKNYKGTLNSSLLAKSLDQRLWDGTPYILKQLPGIGMVTAKALHSMGVTSFESLAEADPRRIEIVTGRKYPFGNHIKESLQSLPAKIDLKIEEVKNQRHGNPKLLMTLTRLSQSIQSTKRHYADMIVGSEEDNLILFHEKIRVEDFSSPYSVMILLPDIQQGMQTVKADLVFEEYIGIDLHQKLLLTKEDNPKIHKRPQNKNPSSYPPAEEVVFVDDGSEIIFQIPNEQTEYLTKSTKENGEDSSMPSFSLFDEDSGEGEPVDPNGDDDCKIITEQTVFDHIREKAKKFSILPTANDTCSSSSGVLNITEKHCHEYKSENAVIGTDIDNCIEAQQSFIDGTTLLAREGPQDGFGNIRHLTSRFYGNKSSLDGMDLTNKAYAACGLPPSDPNDKIIKSFTQETIFDHIQKKAKHFPVLKKPAVESEPVLLKGGYFSGDQPDWRTDYGITCDKTLNDDQSCITLISGSKTNEMINDACNIMEATKDKENTSFDRSRGLYGLVNLSPKVTGAIVANSRNDPSAIKMLNFDISMAKSNVKSYSPGKPNIKCSTIETASPSKEGDLFVGFKSVFSFL